jgi:hypothetical protein
MMMMMMMMMMKYMQQHCYLERKGKHSASSEGYSIGAGLLALG